MLRCCPGSHMTSVAALGRPKKPLMLSICFDSAIPLLLVGLLPEFCLFAVEHHAGASLAMTMAVCGRTGTSDSVVDYFALTPPKIEQHFGISRGHIHCVDNGFRCFLDAIDINAAKTVTALSACWCTGTSHESAVRWCSFLARMPYATPVPGLYSASAGTHPAGSVMGCAGHNSAWQIISDLGLEPYWQGGP